MTGATFSPDTLELLLALQVHRVRYLIVGGVAVIHHGYPRLTGDVDLFYDRRAPNARRLFGALRDFWRGDVPAIGGANELEEPHLILQFGRPPNRVDLLSSLGSVDFASAWRRRVVESIRTKRGATPIHIVSLRDLLTSKRDAGRHKDLDDVEHLEATPARRRRPT